MLTARTRSAHGAIVQVTAGYGDSRRQVVIANSDGLYTTNKQVRTRFMVTCVASGDAGRQTGYEVLARTVSLELSAGRCRGSSRASRAESRFEAHCTAGSSGAFPVVIKGGSGGVLFHEAFSAGLERTAHLVEGARPRRPRAARQGGSEPARHARGRRNSD